MFYKVECMFGRWVEPLWKKKFLAPYAHIVFGARQTGKSMLLRKLLPDAQIWLDFSRPAERAEYLRNPDRLVQQCRALRKSRTRATVVVDEAQNVPAIFDAVQHLYDSTNAVGGLCCVPAPLASFASRARICCRDAVSCTICIPC